MVIEIRIIVALLVVNPRIMCVFRRSIQTAGAQADTFVWTILDYGKIAMYGCYGCFDYLKIVFDKVTNISDLPFHDYHLLQLF